MKTDIWMPWYPGDYQRDTQHLSTLEHGAYRLLIDACWCRGGSLPSDDDDLARITHLTSSEWATMRNRIAKFFQTDNGEWTHKRVTIELNRAKSNAESQSRRTEAARQALQTKRQFVTMSVTENVTKSSSPSPSPSPSVQMNRKEGGHPSLEEVKTKAAMTGMPESDAVAFWNHFEATGWIDKHGHPIVRWESKMSNWKVSARSGPAESAHHAGPARSGNGATDKILMSKELDRVEEKIKEIRGQGSADAFGLTFDDVQKSQLRDLRARQRELKSTLGFTA